MISFMELRKDLAKILGRFLDEDEAQAESWRWFEEGLDWNRAKLIAKGDEAVPGVMREQIGHWLRRRREGEPWAYILGWCEFRGRRFRVDHNVLIPRPETDMLIEAALELGKRLGVDRAVDVGTGSGIIAISLALETNWLVTATDLSPQALGIAKQNADALNAEVRFLEGDLLSPLESPLGLVISNPPYVAEEDRPTLQRELSFEPAMALFSGDRGLEHPTALLRQTKERGAAACLLEIGSGQGDELTRRARSFGWRDVELRSDFAGHDRVLVTIA
jgi:release factor glutamine methyltransferase